MIRICGTINHDWLEDEREGRVKNKLKQKHHLSKHK